MSNDIEDILKGDGRIPADRAENIKTALRAEGDKASAWQSICSRTSIHEQNTQGRVIPMWMRMARVAAVILPLAAAAVFVAKNGGDSDVFYYASTSDADTISLADGSTVILGKGSELAFSMSDDERNASIKGIAKFMVRHDEACPFSVDAENANVRVLGTTFSVEHWPGEERVRTRVEQGRVAMSAGDSEVRLTAGEEAVWTGSELSKCESAVGGISIGSRRMVFHSASLRQVADEILTCYHGEVRGVNFNCAEDSVLITTSFVNQSIESVVEELNLHFDKNISLHNGYLTITD